MVGEGRTQEFGQFYEGGNRMRVEIVCPRSYSYVQSLSFYSTSFWKPLKTDVFSSPSSKLSSFLPGSYHITSSWELP